MNLRVDRRALAFVCGVGLIIWGGTGVMFASTSTRTRLETRGGDTCHVRTLQAQN
jgi:hypothetical protein